MNTNLNNKTEFNQSEINIVNTRSKHTIKLEGQIKILNNLNATSKSLETRTSETNKIINTKIIPSNLKSEIKLERTNLNKKILTLVNLLIPNKYNNNLQTFFSSASTFNAINNQVKYFGIGNNYMTLNVFKNLLNILNTNIEQVQEKAEQNNNDNIRYYINLLTNFEFKLHNSNYNLYRFNKTSKYFFAMQKASKFLNLNFNSIGCYISKPSFNLIYTNNKIENEVHSNLNQNLKLNTTKISINLFYYIKTTETYSEALMTQNNKPEVLSDQIETKFSYLTDYLTNLFNTEVELNLVRLYQPYQDSNILVQYLNGESYNNKFIKLISQLFKNININNNNNSNLSSIGVNNQLTYPAKISGVNIKLAGRPLNERIIPRLTVKRAQRGSFNRLNAKLIEKSMFTDKTKKGAFSFTVTLSQNFKN